MALNYHPEGREKSKTSGFEQQGSYVYKVPSQSAVEGNRDRKRRKLRDAAHVENGCLPFAPLLAGQEDKSAVELRYRAFQTFWSSREETVQAILRDAHSEVLTNIAAFLDQATSHGCEGRIPTGVITLGANISSVGNLFHRLQERAECNGQNQVIVLDSGSASNLKALLKTMIRAAITHSETEEEYRQLISDRLGPKLLPYDLELLYEYVRKRGSEKIVIGFKDTEAFDQRLLSDFISLISSWLDRIPFVLLFGVVTSMELFEGRLPRSTVNLLQGRHFEIQDSDNSADQIFAALQNHDDGGLWLGHGVSKLIVQNSRDHFQSPERFKANIKYALMTHFFANPLSIFLAQNVPVKVLEHARLCEAIRNLPSFRRHVNDILEEGGDTATARKLLDDDAYLASEARTYIESGQGKMKSMFDAVECVVTVAKFLGNFKSTTYSDLAVLALQGQLLDSKIVRDTTAAVKKAPLDLFRNLLEVLPERFTEAGEILRDLDSVLTRTRGSDPLRSQYDDRQTTHKTAVVGQSVKLTKGKVKPSKEESEYTALIDRLDTAFAKYLSNRLITPESLFMHEAFLSDHRTPTKEAFNPRTRCAIERGLSTPADYLGSHSNDDATDDDESVAKLSSSQPALSVLYQLYAESGAFVNIYDLWQAFYTIIGGVDGESCDERLALAMFYRSLSELKMMGMFKSTRKKPDHLAKSTWAGL